MDSRVVYTGGTFDLFHAGHVNLLRQCRYIAGRGRVVVALNTDEFIESYKGSSPVCSFEDRRKVLEACRYVDEVIPNWSGGDSKPTIMSVRPSFIVIGSDWAQKDYYAQMQFSQEWLDEHNIVLVYVPYTDGISSTQIKERIG
jgi:glycerol-3-phosphate cytidylyltransferase